MTIKTSIVVTTIFEPAWLQGYLDNLERWGHKEDTVIRIMCDKKTPATVYQAAEEAAAQGFNIDCPSLEEQQRYLEKVGLPDGFIPWNTDNRRNIGFLRAWEEGADVLISIDDDNYCPESDFVGAHHVIGSTAQQAAALTTENNTWFNACERLVHNSDSVIYPRGYPYAARADKQQQATAVEMGSDDRRVSVNAGLWTDDPDVDAITRLSLSPVVSDAEAQAVVMAKDTWCPVNTQNTALLREAMPAYYYIRMGYSLKGLSIDRFGDIMSGFFLQKCAYHLGDAVRFGDPVARHLRSPHNLLKDLYHELAGITLLEDLLPWLVELELTGSTYAEAYASLADAMTAAADSFTGFVWDEGGREFLKETADCMRTWLAVCEKLA
jgi:hypothetical protein